MNPISRHFGRRDVLQSAATGVGGALVLSSTAAGGAITDGPRVYFGTGSQEILAVHAETGERAWTTNITGVPDSTIVVDGTLYANVESGITALDATTGDQEWTYNIPPSRPVRNPTVFDGAVYSGTSSGNHPASAEVSFSLDAETGAERWYREERPIDGPFRVTDSTLYAISGIDELVQLNPNSGSVSLQFEIPETRGVESVHKVGDTLYTSSGFISAIEPNSGDVLWEYGNSEDLSRPPTVTETAALIPTFSSGLFAVDTSTGEELWTKEDIGGFLFGTITVADGQVIAATIGGDVYSFDSETGDEQWHIAEQFEYPSIPTVFDGTAWIGTDVGTLYCIDIRSGEIFWKFSLGELTNIGNPTIVADPADGSSIGSRILLGTEEHHDDLREPVTGVSLDPVEDTDDPSLANSICCVNTVDGTVTGFSVEDGSQVWENTTLDKPVSSSPTVFDGLLYMGTHTDNSDSDTFAGPLFAVFDVESGDTYGVTQTGIGGIGGSPTISDGKLFLDYSIGGASSFGIYDSKSLDRLAYITQEGKFSTPFVQGESMYVGTTEGRVIGFDVSAMDLGETYVISEEDSGEEVMWKYDLGVSTSIRSPVAVDESVFANSRFTVVRLGADDGVGKWETQVPEMATAITHAYDRLYAGTAEEASTDLFALDATSGDELWRASIGSSAEICSPVTVAGGSVIAATTSGKIAAVDAFDGTVHWEVADVTGSMQTGPTYYDNRVYIATDYGTVHALAVDSGEELWSEEIAAEAAGTPTVVDPSSLRSVDSATLSGAIGHHEEYEFPAYVKIESIEQPESVLAGENTEISLSVQNPTGTPISDHINVSISGGSIDDPVVGSEEITVDPNGTETVSVDFEVPEVSKEKTVSILASPGTGPSESRSVSVRPSSDTSQGSDSDDTSQPSDSGDSSGESSEDAVPGFGIAEVVSAVGGLALYLKRKSDTSSE